MATTITKRSDGVLIQSIGYAGVVASFLIPFGYIAQITKKEMPKRVLMLIILSGNKPSYLPDRIELVYSTENGLNITSPASSSFADLRAQILAMNAGYVQPQEFTAQAGQTDFVITYPLGSSFEVHVNGLLQSVSDYTYTFPTLSFSSALSGGEIVSVTNIK